MEYNHQINKNQKDCFKFSLFYNKILLYKLKANQKKFKYHLLIQDYSKPIHIKNQIKQAPLSMKNSSLAIAKAIMIIKNTSFKMKAIHYLIDDFKQKYSSFFSFILANDIYKNLQFIQQVSLLKVVIKKMETYSSHQLELMKTVDTIFDRYDFQCQGVLSVDQVTKYLNDAYAKSKTKSNNKKNNDIFSCTRKQVHSLMKFIIDGQIKIDIQAQIKQTIKPQKGKKAKKQEQLFVNKTQLYNFLLYLQNNEEYKNKISH